MKVRRPLKYVLIVAGLAAGWAAGGLLDRHGEPEKPPPPGHREPQTRPAAKPAAKTDAAVQSGPLSPVLRGEG